ncbi:hypothetical protein [Falsiroseomonas sp.]|uniref:hypothetical protein n=1 Tax=Falsiroseomonas sp. TaxID=2870721 RepID=UPI0027369A30|nr:hypothetical protein [Falsiroseomonas sp.]MDP3417891.1 hypothetical protein [Falsiroseomonas sp.]
MLFTPTTRATPSRNRKDVMRAVRAALAGATDALPDRPHPEAFLRDFERRAEHRAPWLFDRDAEGVAASVVHAALLGLPLDWEASDLVQVAGGAVRLRVLRFGLAHCLGQVLDHPLIQSAEMHARDVWTEIETRTGQKVIRTPGTDADRGPMVFAYASIGKHLAGWHGKVTVEDAAARIAARGLPWVEDVGEIARMMALAEAAEVPLAELPERWPAVVRCRRVMALACGEKPGAAAPVGSVVPEAARARRAAQAAILRLSGLSRKPKWLRDQLAEIASGLGEAA